MTQFAVSERSESPAPSVEEALVQVESLVVDFWTGEHWANVVGGVSFSVRRGEGFGIVGESGCGKSTTAYALLAYLRRNSRVRSGRILLEGRDLLQCTERQLRPIRGRRISLVPQDPTTALSPGIRIGDQLVEAMKVHGFGGSNRERLERAHELLRQVRLPESQRSARKYPHQLSGGQQQRVVIAMALACEPELVVLDEPTTGLDVTTQAQILELLARLRAEHGMSMLYVTHNLGVISTICDRVAVMYAGHLVEEASTSELFRAPRHPYTKGLIASVPSLAAPEKGRSILLQGLLRRDLLPPGCRFAPRCEHATDRCFAERQTLSDVGPAHRAACWRWRELPSFAQLEARAAAISPPVRTIGAEVELSVADLDCAYGNPRGLLSRTESPRVVRNLGFDIKVGETFALVGESGSGKSTIARAVGGLIRPVSGSITFRGDDITRLVSNRSKKQRQQIQLVLQNPDASLNPRQRVRQIIGRPLELFHDLGKQARQARVSELLEDVRLPATFARRYPDELSGGERQRVAIARALAADPSVVLCDEVLSALDVSVQADVLDLLRALQRDRSLAYLFISHDLAVVRSISNRVGVLYRGELCEVGLADEVYTPPFHPYTHMLLSAVPEIGYEVNLSEAVRLDAHTSADVRTACPFADRCPWKVGPICETVPPPWQLVGHSQAIRCHIPLGELRQRAEAEPLPAMAPANS